jgi:iron complex transport system substrate-binding protein
MLGGCSALDRLFSKERLVSDHLGREVLIPAASELRSVYVTSPLAQLFCFTVAPDLLAGTSRLFSPTELQFLPPGSGELAYLGTLSRGGIINSEALRINGVQLVFSISGTALTPINVDMGLELEQESGIPVFFIDGSLERIGDSYRLLGECLNRQERASSLANYCEQILQQVTGALAAVPDRDLLRYYYAEGPEGLLTETDQSQHSLAFTLARGINVADKKELIEGRNELVPVTAEQLVSWNPDIIITGFTVGWGADVTDYRSSQADEVIRSTAKYSGIAAVRNNRVVRMPSLPFAFCDRPPGVNRFLGIQWLANLFYPDYYDVNMVDVVREFYARCYWQNLTVEQAQRILDA